MNRKSELLSIIHKKNGAENEIKARQIVDEVCFLEEQLEQLKKLPFITVNPKDPTKQKSTPAARQYKELLQQYNNTVKLLLRICGEIGNDEAGESPLREWIRQRKEML